MLLFISKSKVCNVSKGIFSTRKLGSFKNIINIGIAERLIVSKIKVGI